MGGGRPRPWTPATLFSTETLKGESFAPAELDPAQQRPRLDEGEVFGNILKALAGLEAPGTMPPSSSEEIVMLRSQIRSPDSHAPNGFGPQVLTSERPMSQPASWSHPVPSNAIDPAETWISEL